MKRSTPKKGRKGKSERPIELNRDWQEIEDQHDRMKIDWGSLAAQLGIDSGLRG